MAKSLSERLQTQRLTCEEVQRLMPSWPAAMVMNYCAFSEDLELVSNQVEKVEFMIRLAARPQDERPLLIQFPRNQSADAQTRFAQLSQDDYSFTLTNGLVDKLTGFTPITGGLPASTESISAASNAAHTIAFTCGLDSDIPVNLDVEAYVNDEATGYKTRMLTRGAGGNDIQTVSLNAMRTLSASDEVDIRVSHDALVPVPIYLSNPIFWVSQ